MKIQVFLAVSIDRQHRAVALDAEAAEAAILKLVGDGGEDSFVIFVIVLELDVPEDIKTMH